MHKTEGWNETHLGTPFELHSLYEHGLGDGAGLLDDVLQILVDSDIDILKDICPNTVQVR